MLTDNCMFSPRRDGVARLRTQIAREIQAENEEKFVMNLLLCFLFISFSCMALIDLEVDTPSFYSPTLVASLETQLPHLQTSIAPSEDPSTGKPTAEISRLAGTPANINIYLLSQKFVGDPH